jgi:uncharacterized membrane protein YgcG
MPRAGNYSANTFGTNANSFPFTESATANPGYYTFSFELDESQLKFRNYNEYIEFNLVTYGDDKHIFTQYASQNAFYNVPRLSAIRAEQAEYDDLPAKWLRIKLIVLGSAVVVAFLIVFLTLHTYKKKKEKYTFYTPTMQMDYFREIPSDVDICFGASLAFCKHKSSFKVEDGYSAIMLSLVRKGYIVLDRINPARDWDAQNTNIIVKYKPLQTPEQEPEPDPYKAVEKPASLFDGMQEEEAPVQPDVPDMPPLTQTERNYFNLIIRHTKGKGDEITLALFQKQVSEDYQFTNSFIASIKKSISYIGVSEGYYQKADIQEPKRKLPGPFKSFIIMGLIIMGLGNLISMQTRLDIAFGSFFLLGLAFIVGGAYLFICTRRLVLLTQFGEDEYAKWHGLYKFLNSETLMNEHTFVELPLWEKYLIAATAFGISAKVIKAISIRCPNVQESQLLSHPYFRTRHFRSTARSSFRSATSSASYSSRSGGHGGYGGGGRGGGGGGGGH